MTLINGDKIITAQLYDNEYEEFTEKKMSIIDFVNAYSDEGVTTVDDILDKIRVEIKAMSGDIETIADVLAILDKYKAESEKTHE